MDTVRLRMTDLSIDEMKQLLTEAADYIDKTHGIGPNVIYGCHLDLDPGMTPDGCVLDSGKTSDCVPAMMLERAGKGKTDCEHWKAVKCS